jgi:hypothetical protein
MIDLRTDLAERSIIETLDGAVRQAFVIHALDSIVARLDRKLIVKPDAPMAWEVVPLVTYNLDLPDVIRSSWVFVLRANVATVPEFHPNSHQRMMSYRGEGDFPVWNEGKWQSNLLTSVPDAPLESRWLSIPVNTWHRSMKPQKNWAVVAFHSASEAELTEVKGDPANPASLESRRYLDQRTQ